jgi:predicted Rossmann-fold nucleotide-binding protein
MYVGDNLELMESVSTTTFLGGNQVLGVIPKALAKADIIGKIVGEELKIFTMSKRMTAMFEHVVFFFIMLWNRNFKHLPHDKS